MLIHNNDYEGLVNLVYESFFVHSNLMKYCHHKKCKKINECPERHSRCESGLDIDTAIAWYLKRLLQGVIRFHSRLIKVGSLPAIEYYRPIYTGASKKDFEIVSLITRKYRNLVDMHYEKYKKLAMDINTMEDIVENIYYIDKIRYLPRIKHVMYI